MIILEILGKIFIELLFEGIVLGLFRLIRKGFTKLIEFLSGTKKSIDPIKTLERKYLYKKIELTENLNDKLKSGQKGTVIEIINEHKVFAEFYDNKGQLIEWDNELAFKIKIEQFRIKNKT